MISHAGAILLRRKAERFAASQDVAGDALLIERCKKHDERAFSEFVDLYQARIFGFVRRMTSSPEEAEDITQDVFIRAFQHFHRFDSRCSVKTWLFRIAHNLCIDHSRRCGRTLSGISLSGDGEEEHSLEIPDDNWSPESVVMRQELIENVEAAIASMSEKLRSVLLLHDREDMAYDEIAVMLGIPEGTVKSRLFLARAHLQSKLAPHFSEGAERDTK